jgi:hypothetical protein
MLCDHHERNARHNKQAGEHRIAGLSTSNGLTPLRVAAALGRRATVELLLGPGGAASVVDAKPLAVPATVAAAADVAAKAAKMARESRERRNSTKRIVRNGATSPSSSSSSRSLKSAAGRAVGGADDDAPLCLWRTPPAATPSALHAALASTHTDWGCCAALVKAGADLALVWHEASPRVPLVCARRAVPVPPAVTLVLKGDLHHARVLLSMQPQAVTQTRCVRRRFAVSPLRRFAVSPFRRFAVSPLRVLPLRRRAGGVGVASLAECVA